MNNEILRTGIAALLPGIEAAIARLTEERDRYKALLASLQEEAPAAAAPAKKLRSGWPADPAERKREMQRRMAARKKPSGAASRWARMTKAERKELLDKMQNAKKKAARARRRAEAPVVRMEHPAREVA